MTFDQPFAGYEILERVGSGAMGTVFKARDLTLQRTVALKVLKPSLARNARYVERLRREARIVAGLNHPHIVAGYDLGEEGGYHFFVMEFVEGRSLRTLLGEWGMFPERQALDVGIQVAAALDHAYRRGVIHRDIKPGNVLITEDNRVKLTDMGLAKGPADLTITRDGATVGTPQYISPEQARDPQQADVRSDLYSLGATLFHMVAGVPPFTGDTMAEVIAKVLSDRAPSASELNPAITDGLSLVIRKLLTKDPALRYQTPAELLEDLRRVEAEQPPQVDARRLERRDGERRRRALWALGGTAAAALVAWGGWALVVGSGADDRGLEGDVGGPRSELYARMQAAETVGARLKLLRGVSRARLRGAELAEFDRETSRLEDEFKAALDQLFTRFEAGDLRERAEQWFQTPEHWREPDLFRSEVVEQAMAPALGLRSVELSQRWRELLTARWQEFRARAALWQQARDADYRQRHADFLSRELPQSWSSELQRLDFAAAEVALRDSLDSFFERPGAPTRAQLTDELRELVEAREAEVVATATAVIEREELRLARALKAVVATSLEDLQQARRSVGAAQVRARYDQLLRELETHPSPDAFRAANNPWREVEFELRAFEGQLRLDLRLAEALALDQAVNRAYRTLMASGEAAEAVAWLEHLDLRDPDNRRACDRHLELLRAAADAIQPLLSALLAGSERRRLSVRPFGGGRGSPLDLEVVAGAKGCVLKAAGSARVMHPGEVHWPDLIAAAGPEPFAASPADERPRLRAGLALWSFASGDVGSTMRLLDDDLRGFFATRVAGPIDRVREVDAPADGGALTGLGAVRAAYDGSNRRLEAVQAALRGFREQFGDDPLAGDARSFLREVDGWVAQEATRQRLDRRLRALAPTGVGVIVGEDLRAELTFGHRALAADGLPPGWVSRGEELAFEAFDVELSEAVGQRAIELSTYSGELGEVVLDLELRFPELPDRHRLYLFELHGVLAAVGLLRDGTVCATIGAGALANRPAELRRRLLGELEGVRRQERPKILPDIAYQLRLRWLSPRRRVKATLWLDGEELATTNLARPSTVPERARVIPLQPLALRGAVLRAR